MRTVLNTVASTTSATLKASSSKPMRPNLSSASRRCTHAVSSCTRSTPGHLRQTCASLSARSASWSPGVRLTTMASGSGLPGKTLSACSQAGLVRSSVSARSLVTIRTPATCSACSLRIRVATCSAAVFGASIFKNTVSSGVTETWRATGCIDTKSEAPSKGNESASAMTSKFVSDEIGAAASRRSVTASA